MLLQWVEEFWMQSGNLSFMDADEILKASGVALKSSDITVSITHSPSRSSNAWISVWSLRPEIAFLIHFLISSAPRISVLSPPSMMTASDAKRASRAHRHHACFWSQKSRRWVWVISYPRHSIKRHHTSLEAGRVEFKTRLHPRENKALFSPIKLREVFA